MAIQRTEQTPDLEHCAHCDNEGRGGAINAWSQKHLRYRVLNFAPSWFSVNMGTGISSILLYNLPYQFTGLKIIADCIFGLNVVLFLLFLVASIARYSIWPSVWGAMLTHPQQSLFLGTFPMGMATIINMIAYTIVPAWGDKWAYFAWSLWFLNAVVSLLTCIGLPFVMFTYHEHSLDKLNAVWLQPVVAPIVASSTGSIVASVLPPTLARVTLIFSYVLWGTGVPLAILILALYFHRLAIHKLPPAAQIVSVFLPLGPCGQGAFAIVNMAKVGRDLAYSTGEGLGGVMPSVSKYSKALSYPYSPAQSATSVADAISGGSVVLALIMLGFGFVWLVIALLSIGTMIRKEEFVFNMGWWAFTFPLGVFSAGTVAVAEALDSTAIKILGTIFSLTEVFLWLYIAARTAISAGRGTMFVAPCLGKDSPSRPKNLREDDNGCKPAK